MTYSFVITSDSAWVTMLQLCPALSSAFDISTKPPPSIFVSVTDGALPLPYSVSQLAPHGRLPPPCWVSHPGPRVMTSRWLNCFCGATADHDLPGCHNVAIANWSR